MREVNIEKEPCSECGGRREKCNRWKGSDIGSILWLGGEFIRFFNPQIDWWADHFRLN